MGGYMLHSVTITAMALGILLVSTDGKIKVLRTITKIGKLYDVSAVSLPANPGTSISARFLDGAIEEARTERSRLLELEEKRQAVIEKAKRVRGEEIDND